MEKADICPSYDNADTERERLSILASLCILDTPPEREFDTIVQSAQSLLGCKIALVSLIDQHRQWFKAKCGLDAAETPYEQAFCAHAIRQDSLLIIPDALADARFARNPLVTGPPHIRFYAGVPIRAGLLPGNAVKLPMGTLCVIDDQPRELDRAQIGILENLAHLVEELLCVRASAVQAIRLAEDRGDMLRTLDRTLRQFRQAERLANIGSWRLTLADNRTEWSEQTYAIHGLPPGDGKPLNAALEFYPAHARPIVEGAIQRTIATGEPWDFETDFVTAQGDHRRVRSMGELELVDGKPSALIGVFQDITTRHQLEQSLRNSAATDELTRIASRRHFNEVFDQHIAASQVDHDPLLLVLIDLDHFKAVNDNFGHMTGDDVLRIMASRLQAPYLADSFAARLGGDEFVLIVRSRQLLSDLPGLLRRLLTDLRHSVSGNGTIIHVSATIGACWLDRDADSRSEMLHRADQALYQAKRAQRGSAKISTSTELITLDYMPKASLRIVGA